MFIDERKLHLPKNKHTLYIAYELALLKVITSKHNTYSKLFTSNSWIRDYLPFFTPHQIIATHQPVSMHILASILRFFEPLARIVQKIVMGKPQGQEIVSDTVLFFHPTDVSTIIMQQYKERLNKYV
jgi:hypothetical protein